MPRKFDYKGPDDVFYSSDNDSISGDPRMGGKDETAHKECFLNEDQTDQSSLEDP